MIVIKISGRNNQHQLNCTRYFLIVKFYSVLFQTDRHVIKQYSGFIIGFIFLSLCRGHSFKSRP